MTDEWCRQIERRLQTQEMFSAVEEVHRVNVEKRLTAIEDTLKWLVRLIVGALIMAAIAYAVQGGLSFA